MDESPAGLRIDIVSDAVCPWCYIGKRQLERALTALSQEGLDFSVHWNPFQLNPDMPKEGRDRAAYRADTRTAEGTFLTRAKRLPRASRDDEERHQGQCSSQDGVAPHESLLSLVRRQVHFGCSLTSLFGEAPVSDEQDSCPRRALPYRRI